MKNNFTVYKHTCPNGKIYIGITSKNIKERWNNGKGYSAQTYFFDDIIKYGWINIKHEILFENLTEEEAKLMERMYIALHDTTNPLKGYNQTLGGNGVLGKEPWNKGKHLSNEHKKKLSESHKGNVYNFKEVMCVTTGERFNSAKEAARKYNLDNSHIIKCCKGKYKYSGKLVTGEKLIWKYVDLNNID